MDTQKQLPFPVEKLAELLLKARAEGITLSAIPRSKRLMIASSGTSANRYYVDADSCTCQAGVFGTPCKHRALWISEHAQEYADAILEGTAQRATVRKRRTA